MVSEWAKGFISEELFAGSYVPNGKLAAVVIREEEFVKQYDARRAQVFPYAVLELGLRTEPPLRSKSVQVFNVGRCSSPSSFGITGAMLDSPDQVDQWKIEFSRLEGELKEGSTIQFDVSLEHKASRYLAEFRGSAPLLLVASSRCQN